MLFPTLGNGKMKNVPSTILAGNFKHSENLFLLLLFIKNVFSNRFRAANGLGLAST